MMANEMMNRHNDMFDRMSDWFNFPRSFFESDDLNLMQSDVAETDQDYIVKVDMPGMTKDKIHVSYTNGTLTISGSRRSFKDLSDKAGNLIHKERTEGHVTRSYRLPSVDSKAIKAQYHDGVLTITLPKQTADENSNAIHID